MKVSKVSVFVLLTGMFFLAMIHYQQLSRIEERAKSQFALEAEEASYRIHSKLESYQEILRSSSSFFAASVNVSRDEFTIFLNESIHQMGILGVCFTGKTDSQRYSTPETSELCEKFANPEKFKLFAKDKILSFGAMVKSGGGQRGCINVLIDLKSLQYSKPKQLNARLTSNDIVDIEGFDLVKRNIPSLSNFEHDLKIHVRGNREAYIESHAPEHYVLLVLVLGFSLLGIFTSEINSRNERITQKQLRVQEESLKKQFDEILLHKKIAHHHAKLASIGELAAGVGHEINNPLTIVKGYMTAMAKQARQHGELSQEAVEDALKKVKTATDRIEKITQGLRAFSRADTVDFSEFDPIEAVQESYSMVKEIYKMDGIDIVLEIKGDTDNLFLLGNRGKFQQVIMNLLSNAKDAVEAAVEKKIWIQIQIFSSGIEIQVRDTGCGIPAEIHDKVLDPFFTTKDVHKGTGIGLSIVHNFVNELQGDLCIESEVGKGAVFILNLPTMRKESMLTVSSTQPEPKEKLEPFMDCKAILADDEEDIREILGIILENIGVNVTEAENGVQVLEMLKKEPDKYDLVISDMKMPVMDGPKLLESIRSDKKISKQPKFIFITGGVTMDLDNQDIALNRLHDGYLYKPFDEEDIHKVLQKALKGKSDVSK